MSGQYHMFEDNFWADQGFDELRRQMKVRSDFCKEVAGLINERADIERQYSKNLSQLARKSRRTGSTCIGTMQDLWQRFCEGVEAETESHKALAQNLQAECLSPLKSFIETKMKMRKPIEIAVDKQKKIYQDRVSEQLKLKKTAHSKCKELEVILGQLESARNVRGRPVNEKEVSKFEKSSHRTEEALIKADRDYKDSNTRTEEARLSWESSMYRCCRYLEQLEHSRLEQMSELMKKYSELTTTLVSPIEETCSELVGLADGLSADTDIEQMCSSHGSGGNQPEQLLLDCYEEELSNQMNEERRMTNLDKKIQELEADIDKKEKEKTGVQTLSIAYEKTPDFSSEQGLEDVTRKLIEADTLLNLLKANHFKLLKARCEFSSSPSPSSPYLEYLETKRDKLGMCSYLKIPVEYISEVQSSGFERLQPSSASATGQRRSTAGGSEWDDDDSDNPSAPYYSEVDVNQSSQAQTDAGGVNYISRCEVAFDYEAQQDDELTITPGDIVFVTEKIDNDWWEGNLDGKIGIFPCSYVEEVEMY